MYSSARYPASPCWPFWALLVAWLCANTPQGAMAVAMVWAGEARTFSHQERLASGVAEILTGEKTTEGVLAKAEQLPSRPQPSSSPAELPWKLLTLQIERTTEFVSPELREAGSANGNWRVAKLLKTPPPHGPPRRV